jgi:hypothetical protein
LRWADFALKAAGGVSSDIMLASALLGVDLGLVPDVAQRHPDELAAHVFRSRHPPSIRLSHFGSTILSVPVFLCCVRRER